MLSRIFFKNLVLFALLAVSDRQNEKFVSNKKLQFATPYYYTVMQMEIVSIRPQQ